MNYYEQVEAMNAKGIDWDLAECLEYNPQPQVSLETIKRVLAVWEGVNEGDSWRWILELTNGKFVFLIGWCDYTGWDCQSDAKSYIYDTVELALKQGKIDYWNSDKRIDVYESLQQQLIQDKNTTWRESMDEEFGLNNSQNLE